jgi:alpha-D-ribose 1-methylphosphonate 5-phosphate C-P lyase
MFLSIAEEDEPQMDVISAWPGGIGAGAVRNMPTKLEKREARLLSRQFHCYPITLRPKRKPCSVAGSTHAYKHFIFVLFASHLFLCGPRQYCRFPAFMRLGCDGTAVAQ